MDNQKSIQTTIIKIDPWSIAKILLILIGLVFLYLIRDIILIVFGALILSFVFAPIIDGLERKKVSRFLSTTMVYLIFLFILVVIIIPLISAIQHEFGSLIKKIPIYYEQFHQYFGSSGQGSPGILQKLLANWYNTINIAGITSQGVFAILGTFFGWIFVIGTILVIAFYLTVQKEALRQTIKSLTPEKYRENVVRLADLIQKDIGAWARGLLILCLLVGLMNYIGLTILGVNFALVLAVLAGILEVVPWLGPWLAGIPAVFVALTQSPVKALMVVILYVAVQQIENNLIVPQVMKRAIGLNPLLVILVILIGAKLAGPVGIILAVPLVTIVIILGKEYLRIKRGD